MLKNTLENDILQQKYLIDDGKGKLVTLALWNHPGNDVTGMVARSEKVAGTMEKVINFSAVLNDYLLALIHHTFLPQHNTYSQKSCFVSIFKIINTSGIVNKSKT